MLMRSMHIATLNIYFVCIYKSSSFIFVRVPIFQAIWTMAFGGTARIYVSRPTVSGSWTHPSMLP